MDRSVLLIAFILIACLSQNVIYGREFCFWCDQTMTSSFMDCLSQKIMTNQQFQGISTDNVDDMKRSMIAASEAMTRSSPSSLMKMLNGALSGEITGVIRSQMQNTGQNADTITDEIMRLIGDCYIAVTGQPHLEFLRNIGKTVDFMLTEDQSDDDYDTPQTPTIINNVGPSFNPPLVTFNNQPSFPNYEPIRPFPQNQGPPVTSSAASASAQSNGIPANNPYFSSPLPQNFPAFGQSPQPTQNIPLFGQSPPQQNNPPFGQSPPLQFQQPALQRGPPLVGPFPLNPNPQDSTFNQPSPPLQSVSNSFATANVATQPNLNLPPSSNIEHSQANAQAQTINSAPLNENQRLPTNNYQPTLFNNPQNQIQEDRGNLYQQNNAISASANAFASSQQPQLNYNNQPTNNVFTQQTVSAVNQPQYLTNNNQAFTQSNANTAQNFQPQWTNFNKAQNPNAWPNSESVASSSAIAQNTETKPNQNTVTSSSSVVSTGLINQPNLNNNIPQIISPGLINSGPVDNSAANSAINNQNNPLQPNLGNTAVASSWSEQSTSSANSIAQTNDNLGQNSQILSGTSDASIKRPFFSNWRQYFSNRNNQNIQLQPNAGNTAVASSWTGQQPANEQLQNTNNIAQVNDYNNVNQNPQTLSGASAVSSSWTGQSSPTVELQNANTIAQVSNYNNLNQNSQTLSVASTSDASEKQPSAVFPNWRQYNRNRAPTYPRWRGPTNRAPNNIASINENTQYPGGDQAQDVTSSSSSSAQSWRQFLNRRQPSNKIPYSGGEQVQATSSSTSSIGRNRPVNRKPDSITINKIPLQTTSKPDAEKTCAMRFVEALYFNLMQSNSFSEVLGSQTPRSFAEIFIPEVNKRGMVDSGYEKIAEEVEAVSKEYISALPDGSTPQLYAEKTSKAIMIPMYKLEHLEDSCEDDARLIAKNILNYYDLVLPFLRSQFNDAQGTAISGAAISSFPISSFFNNNKQKNLLSSSPSSGVAVSSVAVSAAANSNQPNGLISDSNKGPTLVRTVQPVFPSTFEPVDDESEECEDEEDDNVYPQPGMPLGQNPNPFDTSRQTPAQTLLPAQTLNPVFVPRPQEIPVQKIPAQTPKFQPAQELNPVFVPKPQEIPVQKLPAQTPKLLLAQKLNPVFVPKPQEIPVQNTQYPLNQETPQDINQNVPQQPAYLPLQNQESNLGPESKIPIINQKINEIFNTPLENDDSEAREQMNKLMTACSSGITQNGYDYTNLMTEMASASNVIKNQHSDWSNDRILSIAYLKTIVACTQVLQNTRNQSPPSELLQSNQNSGNVVQPGPSNVISNTNEGVITNNQPLVQPNVVIENPPITNIQPLAQPNIVNDNPTIINNPPIQNYGNISPIPIVNQPPPASASASSVAVSSSSNNFVPSLNQGPPTNLPNEELPIPINAFNTGPAPLSNQQYNTNTQVVSSSSFSNNAQNPNLFPAGPINDNTQFGANNAEGIQTAQAFSQSQNSFNGNGSPFSPQLNTFGNNNNFMNPAGNLMGTSQTGVFGVSNQAPTGGINQGAVNVGTSSAASAAVSQSGGFGGNQWPNAGYNQGVNAGINPLFPGQPF